METDKDLLDAPWSRSELETACIALFLALAVAVLGGLTLAVRLLDARRQLADCRRELARPAAALSAEVAR